MKSKKSNDNITQLFKKSVISIVIAAIAAMLGIVIDGIVIGRFLGPESMAAYSLTSPVINLVSVFSGVLSTGTQVVCARYLGAGNTKKARGAFSVCMAVTAVISVIIVGSTILFRNDMAILLGARGNSAYLAEYASDYLLGLAFSFPAFILLFEFNSLMRLDGDAGRIFVAVAVMTVLDITGDLLNALYFHGGMLGMGIATTISYVVALIIMLLHFYRTKS